jgi:hypothetical protein
MVMFSAIGRWLRADVKPPREGESVGDLDRGGT